MADGLVNVAVLFFCVGVIVRLVYAASGASRKGVVRKEAPRKGRLPAQGVPVDPQARGNLPAADPVLDMSEGEEDD